MDLSDKDADIRITGLRLARQLKGLDVTEVVQKLVKDASPQVRRDAAIALRHSKSPKAAELWAELAAQHDGKDRWYLEALGIGADKQWDLFFSTWRKQAGEKWNTPAGRDIGWRSRSIDTPNYLGRIISDPTVTVAELPRYFRAFDFQKGDGKDGVVSSKDEVLGKLAFAEVEGPRQELIAAESITRIKNFDVKKNPEYAKALDKLLDKQKGSSSVWAGGRPGRPLSICWRWRRRTGGQLGVNAAKLLL